MPATNELLQEGRYRIGQRATGNENSFEAYDTVRNVNVVVREIPVKLNRVMTVSQQESLKHAFTNQAKALTEIEHKSLPHVHDFFSEIDRQYLVIEAVDGEDLGGLVSRNRKPFSVAEVTSWADQLLDALQCLHTHKPSLVHRNIRPYNVNRDASGKIKLLGIGLDSSGDPSAVDDAVNLRYSPIEQIWPGLDAASQKVITNSYDDRSERILKEPLDARSDIYSLGATLYYLITGCEPVDPLERSIDILEGKLDPLREPSKVDENIPAEISDVLMKALEIKRENRYDSAMIMRAVLKDAIDRVQERDAEDDREQQEAAEIIRNAAQAKNPAVELAEEKRRQEAEAEQQRQLREAEEQRILAVQREQAERLERERQEADEALKAKAEAERVQLQKREEEAAQAKAEAERLQREEEEAAVRAKAEAERVQREKEESEARAAAEAKDEAKATTPDENLLEIPVSAEVMAYREPASPDEAELAAVLKEIEEAEAETVKAERGGTDAETEHSSVQVLDHPVDAAPQSTSYESDDDDVIISAPEKSAFSLPIPAIAGAIGLVVMLVVGGWFMLSGSSEAEKPAPVQAVQVAEPAPEQNPTPETIVSTEAQPETVASTDPSADQSLAAAKPTPAKAKKAEPAKPDPAKKKAVTVDDLINDN